MPSLLNRSGVWYANFYDATRCPPQRRHSLKTRKRRVAKRLLSKLDDAYRQGEWDAWTQGPEEYLNSERVTEPIRLGVAVDEYMGHQTEVRSLSTLQSYRSHTRLLVSVIGSSTYLERINPSDVRRYVTVVGGSNRPPSQGSQRQRLIVAKSFFSWTVQQSYLRSKPSDAVEWPKKPIHLPKAVTDAELDAILSTIPDTRAWTREVFEFAALTGLRISELCRLKWDDIDFERRLLRIEQQKNGKAQTQPFPLTAIEVLHKVARRGPHVFMAPNAYAVRRVPSWCKDVATVFREARLEAGIERPITPHGLRHRYCTKLAEAGASAFVIQKAARHSDVRTSQVYVSIANEELRSRLDEVFG